MDALIQLLSLNFKTLMNLLKIYFSGALTYFWTSIDFSFQNVFAPSSVDFIIKFFIVFAVFYLGISFVIELIQIELAKVLEGIIRKKNRELDYVKWVMQIALSLETTSLFN